jgi:hypothetical protein
MEHPFFNSKEIIDKVNSIYNSFKDGNLIKNNWIITNEPFYYTYKNKINITHINYFKDTIGHYYEDYLVYDYRFSFETIKRYGVFKYNTNFIAGRIGDTEYDVFGDLQLIAVNSQIMDNYNGNNATPPDFEEVLSILGWKIKQKPLLYVKDDLKYK